MDTQLLQISGSVLILLAFILLLIHQLSANSWKYLLINFIGASILTVSAFYEQQWGFLLLQVVWAGVSLGALVKLFIKLRN